jgi:hypothetical protein
MRLLLPAPLVQEVARPLLGESAIRDTVERVFQAGVYNQTTLAQRFFIWLAQLFRAIGAVIRSLVGMVSQSTALSWAVVVLAIIVIVAITSRILYLWQLRRLQHAASPVRLGDAWFGGRGDALALAEDAARQGNFTEAAHALYEALLRAIARTHQIKLHPSKTVGDYGRELRAKGSTLLTRYREFGRDYETVIYGVGTCDRERFERLYVTAAPILRPNG